MTIAEYLEGFMLFCFSISWYWSIAKMLKTKVAAGKSLQFVVMICTGYIFGITSKLLAWDETGVLSALVYLYCWNFLVTAFDAYLVLRYSPKRPRTGASYA